jgi:hypothetical protein
MLSLLVAERLLTKSQQQQFLRSVNISCRTQWTSTSLQFFGHTVKHSKMDTSPGAAVVQICIFISFSFFFFLWLSIFLSYALFHFR